jgi:hypothetical protein
MKTHFPGDVLIIIVGPFFVIGVALVVSNVIVYTSQWSRSTAMVVCSLVLVSIAAAVVLAFRRRRR